MVTATQNVVSAANDNGGMVAVTTHAHTQINALARILGRRFALSLVPANDNEREPGPSGALPSDSNSD